MSCLFLGGKVGKGKREKRCFFGGGEIHGVEKKYSPMEITVGISRYCFRQGLLKETRLQLEKKEPLPRYV